MKDILDKPKLKGIELLARAKSKQFSYKGPSNSYFQDSTDMTGEGVTEPFDSLDLLG